MNNIISSGTYQKLEVINKKNIYIVAKIRVVESLSARIENVISSAGNTLALILGTNHQNMPPLQRICDTNIGLLAKLSHCDALSLR